MSESLLRCLGNEYNTLPSCAHYSELISLLHQCTGWDYDDIRSHFGEFTYKEWGNLIGCAQRESH